MHQILYLELFSICHVTTVLEVHIYICRWDHFLCTQCNNTMNSTIKVYPANLHHGLCMLVLLICQPLLDIRSDECHAKARERTAVGRMDCGCAVRTAFLLNWVWVCVIYWHLVSIRTFGIMCDHTLFYACKSPDQTSGLGQSECQPGDLPLGFVLVCIMH